ncbi:hypothetical protein ACPUER_15930 [Burkholderia sp. DN3021]|uniref:hypothetical protein n=1 Tax=Burkholderia TaxID=32008 RepID=UPI0015889AC4|nr:hypothetical protein [Burkholderia pyrrocinia]
MPLAAAAPSRRTLCSIAPADPSRKPANSSTLSAYRSEPAAYTRHPASPCHARLAQLNSDVCGGFCAGAFAAPHTSEDAGKLTCDAQSSTSVTCCPAMLVPIRNQGRNAIHRFPPAEHFALGDRSTACTVRSTAVDAGGTHFTLPGEGRGCLGGIAYSLVEKIYVLRDSRPVLVKSNRVGF